VEGPSDSNRSLALPDRKASKVGENIFSDS
jgi:hypothetical protein